MFGIIQYYTHYQPQLMLISFSKENPLKNFTKHELNLINTTSTSIT